MKHLQIILLLLTIFHPLLALQNWYNADTRLQREYQFNRSELKLPGNDTVLAYYQFEMDTINNITTYEEVIVGGETAEKKYGHQYDESGDWLRELSIEGNDTIIEAERISKSDTLWIIQHYDTAMTVQRTIYQIYKNGLLIEESSTSLSQVSYFTYTPFNKIATEYCFDTLTDSMTYFAEYIYEDELLVLDSLNWDSFQYKHYYEYEQGRLHSTSVFEDGVNSMNFIHRYQDESLLNSLSKAHPSALSIDKRELSFTDKREINTVKLYTLSGKELLNLQPFKKSVLLPKNIAAGTYVVRVNDSRSIVKVQ